MQRAMITTNTITTNTKSDDKFSYKRDSKSHSHKRTCFAPANDYIQDMFGTRGALAFHSRAPAQSTEVFFYVENELYYSDIFNTTTDRS